MTDEFYIRVSNNLCGYQSNGWVCKNGNHPDYSPWKTRMCSFEKCPLTHKCKPLTEEEKETIKEGQKIETDSLKTISDRFR